jgi:hypothetical protein
LTLAHDHVVGCGGTEHAHLLAGITFRNVRAAIDEGDSAGEINIGTSILKRFVLTLDYSRRAAWFQGRVTLDNDPTLRATIEPRCCP